MIFIIYLKEDRSFSRIAKQTQFHAKPLVFNKHSQFYIHTFVHYDTYLVHLYVSIHIMQSRQTKHMRLVIAGMPALKQIQPWITTSDHRCCLWLNPPADQSI